MYLRVQEEIFSNTNFLRPMFFFVACISMHKRFISYLTALDAYEGRGAPSIPAGGFTC